MCTTSKYLELYVGMVTTSRFIFYVNRLLLSLLLATAVVVGANGECTLLLSCFQFVFFFFVQVMNSVCILSTVYGKNLNTICLLSAQAQVCWCCSENVNEILKTKLKMRNEFDGKA